MSKYYIYLIAKNKFCREWRFETIEERNAIYDKLTEKFRHKKSSNGTFIEVGIGIDDSSDLSSMGMPLRLQDEAKDDVIKYMDD